MSSRIHLDRGEEISTKTEIPVPLPAYTVLNPNRRWARAALEPAVIDAGARLLSSIVVVRPMIDYYLTLHDAGSLDECAPENLVYKIDSGWALGSRAPKPQWDPLAGDANTTGKVFVPNIPLSHGLTCSSVGQNGEFVIVYELIPVATPL